MGWLLELLLDGIREICSQFIVDMMELVTEMFTELLSCNLSLFEELFSVVSALYKNVIVPMGIAMLLVILVWQLFKSMFGKSVNGEEPVELLIRSAIALFFVVAAKPIVNYILKFAGTPYQWVVGTEIKVESFSGFVSALEGVTETLGVGKLSISLLMLIMQFVVAWNYFKMLFVIAERYVLLGVFSYTAPLAFSTGGSKSTNNILASWSKMFGGQVVLIILNAWCMKMFLSGYGNMMASSYGFTKFFVATLCLVGFCKITFKMDSYLVSLGVNLGRPSAGMWAMGLIMAASRIFSQIGRGSAGDGGSAPSAEADTSQAPENGMPEGFTGPIPMMPGNAQSPDMEMPDSSSESGFDETPDISEDAGGFGTAGYPEREETGGSGVLEELGVVTSENTEGGADPGIRTDTGGIGRTEAVGTENGSVLENLSGDKGIQISDAEDEASMDMGISGIPEYTDGTGITDGLTAQDGAGTGSMSVRETTDGTASEPGYGDGGAGIISEMGDYPVEEEFSDGVDENLMELDGSTIDSMGSGPEAEDVSYGNAGDAFGNASLASSRASRSGADFGSTAAPAPGIMPGIDSSGASEGIISEVGADFGSGSIEPYGSSDTAGGNRNPQEGSVRPESDGTGTLDDLGLSGDADGYIGSGGMDFGSGSIAPYGTPDAAGGSGELQRTAMETGNGGGGVFDDPGLSGAASDVFGDAADHAGRGIEAYSAAEEETTDEKVAEDVMMSGENTAGVLPGITPSPNSTGVSDKVSGDPDMDSSKSYEDGESCGVTGSIPVLHGAADHISERATMPEGGNAEENPFMADDGMKDTHMPLENTDHSMEPMDGQMNHTRFGGTIPAGNQKRDGRRKPVREFREVPRTREELRHRQQERKEQKPTDGTPLK